ncbi:hypothetical protein [Eubacterium sp. 1001713B170207_170306_E7]|uniref:hypothetical protein n=1 Tax=Eubacterium sp. 1001713B170207_170306_E7 TaxID=2787097 RepID=UPI001898EF99|nr:hypothetical protein [Eubacterium sp. 1001713B170207_170306_E7]
MFTEAETRRFLWEIGRGYRYERIPEKAIDIWYPVWIEAVSENRNMKQHNFSACFRRSVELGPYINPRNWIVDFEEVFLYSKAKRADERFHFCTTMLERFCGRPNPVKAVQYQRNLAELFYCTGDSRKGEALYQKIIKKEKTNVWNWSDYASHYCSGPFRDYGKALSICAQGIDAIDMIDEKPACFFARETLYKKTEEIYTLLGREKEASEWREKYTAERQKEAVFCLRMEEEKNIRSFLKKPAAKPRVQWEEPSPALLAAGSSI